MMTIKKVFNDVNEVVYVKQRSWWVDDLVDVRDELPILRHVGFLVIGSEFALDGEEKDLEIPLLLKPR